MFYSSLFPLTDFCFLCSSANETLSTLKFAQRAKLIQNNVHCTLFVFKKVICALIEEHGHYYLLLLTSFAIFIQGESE